MIALHSHTSIAKYKNIGIILRYHTNACLFQNSISISCQPDILDALRSSVYWVCVLPVVWTYIPKSFEVRTLILKLFFHARELCNFDGGWLHPNNERIHNPSMLLYSFACISSHTLPQARQVLLQPPALFQHKKEIHIRGTKWKTKVTFMGR